MVVPIPLGKEDTFGFSYNIINLVEEPWPAVDGRRMLEEANQYRDDFIITTNASQHTIIRH
jgi:hypothetical protein